MNTIGLTCIFTLNGTNLGPNEAFGVSFESDGTRGYGGIIKINTPAMAGPVTTGLWDNDGNVLFTIYLTGGSSQASCVINSGSNPGQWVPLIDVMQENGLTCTVTQTGNDPSTNTYEFSLDLTITSSTC